MSSLACAIPGKKVNDAYICAESNRKTLVYGFFFFKIRRNVKCITNMMESNIKLVLFVNMDIQNLYLILFSTETKTTYLIFIWFGWEQRDIEEVKKQREADSANAQFLRWVAVCSQAPCHAWRRL